MGLVSATVTAVLMSMATPSAEPEAFAAFFSHDGSAVCEALAVAMNEDPDRPDSLRYYCD